MAHFTLHIDLGNDDMQTTSDVSTALHTIAEKVYSSWEGSAGPVIDRNGNRVGSWEWNEEDN